MQTFFLSSRHGPLFCRYSPAESISERNAVVHVPAFGEEMNKSRRMISLQVDHFNAAGYAVLVFDLYGTGDSGGDFGEATWAIWLDNLQDVVAWVKEQGIESVDFWSLRLGGLLAIDFISRNPGLVSRLLLWHPVLNGETFLTQFLRLRVAAAMISDVRPPEKTGDLKMQLVQGQAIEVVGYQLDPELALPMMKVTIEPEKLTSLSSVAVFELVANVDALPVMANQQFIDKLLARGIDATVTKVIGEQFWSSQEITIVPALLPATANKQ
jgi:exosortase A-associated hydrolase 2